VLYSLSFKLGVDNQQGSYIQYYGG